MISLAYNIDVNRRTFLASGLVAIGGCLTRRTSEPPSKTSTATPTPSAVKMDLVEVTYAKDRVIAVGGQDAMRPQSISKGQTTAGQVVALDPATEQPQWRHAFERAPMSRPHVAGDTIYQLTGWSSGMTGNDLQLHALSVTGDHRWQTALVDKFVDILAIDDQHVYLGTYNDAISTGGESLIAIDRAGGGRAWSVEAGSGFGGALTDDALLLSEGGMELGCYRRSDGKTRWQSEAEPIEVHGGGPLHGDDVAILNGEDSIIGVSIADGTTQWTFEPETSEPFVVPGGIHLDGISVIHEYDGILIALESTTGERQWSFQTETETTGDPPVRFGPYLTTIDKKGRVYGIEVDSGTSEWEVSLNAGSRLVGTTDDRLVLRNGSSLVAIDRSGTVRTRAQVNGQIHRATLGPSTAYLLTDGGAFHAFDLS